LTETVPLPISLNHKIDTQELTPRFMYRKLVLVKGKSFTNAYKI